MTILGVMRGHSRPKDGVATLAYDSRIHRFAKKMDGRVKPGHDGGTFRVLYETQIFEGRS